ncbi:GntR family transcriptional regulator [Amycolatopsis sp. cg5]|uniref:GntR family transcriptional regulator n=1 Tax=Amycolatopsis sp. cg5 TaxID=3238802 RepID=UPI003526064E
MTEVDLRPWYVRISDDLRARIISGALPVGAQLPSYVEIRRTYGVSIATARKAVAVLRRDGYAYTAPGRGSVVVSQHPARDRDTTRRVVAEAEAGLDALIDHAARIGESLSTCLARLRRDRHRDS